MIVIASPRQILPLRAHLPTATVALAQMAGRGHELNQSSRINKAGLNRIYRLIPSSRSKQSARSTRHPRDRHAPRSKSP
jgi:hypothetical protein